MGPRIVTDTSIKAFEERHGRKPTKDDMAIDPNGFFVYKVDDSDAFERRFGRRPTSDDFTTHGNPPRFVYKVDKRAAFRRQVNFWSFVVVVGALMLARRLSLRKLLREYF